MPLDADRHAAYGSGSLQRHDSWLCDTNMPSWWPLNPASARRLGRFHQDLVASLGKGKARRRPSPFRRRRPIKIESILHGRELFQKLECWKCHGPAGHGDGPSAATLTDSKDNPIRPYNFSTGTRFKCGDTNQDLYRIFMTGLDGYTDAFLRRRDSSRRCVGPGAFPPHPAGRSPSQELDALGRLTTQPRLRKSNPSVLMPREARNNLSSN